MTPDDMIEFWYQAGEAAWFEKNAAFDGALAVRFGAALKEARLGAFDHWGETPRGALGLVLLLDQVSRNIHRGSPLAFAADAKALRHGKAVDRQGLSSAIAAALRPLVPDAIRTRRGHRRPAPLRGAVQHHGQLTRWPIGPRSTSTSSQSSAAFPIAMPCWGESPRRRRWPSCGPAGLPDSVVIRPAPVVPPHAC